MAYIVRVTNRFRSTTEEPPKITTHKNGHNLLNRSQKQSERTYLQQWVTQGEGTLVPLLFYINKNTFTTYLNQERGHTRRIEQ